MSRFGMVTDSKSALIALAALAVGSAAFYAANASGQERKAIPPKDSGNPLTELISGYYFSPLETRALQDDDFDNPGFSWVQRGEGIWASPDGGAGKSCASCHGSASDAMRGKAASYPKHDASTGRVLNLEHRINKCREGKMRAPAWAYDSDELLAMTAYLRLQSRGSPVNVDIAGPAKGAFEAGRTLYNGRLGQLGMSCALCHDKHYGRSFRNDVLSQGHSNGFPVYRRGTGSFLSLHERFNSCFAVMRAAPHPLGSDEYIALELYLAWRGNGLAVETPAVRQ